MRSPVHIILILVSTGFFQTSFCQPKERTCSYIFIPEGNNIPGLSSLPESTSDSALFISRMRDFRAYLLNEGYLTAGVESFAWSDDSVNVVIHTGQKFKWARLSPGNLPLEVINRLGINESLYIDKKFAPSDLALLIDKILDYHENSGFPFVELTLDSIKISGDKISAELNLERNQFTTIDSLIIKGDIKTNRSYIENYLGFKKGAPYDQSRLSRIPNRLREIPFISSLKPYEVGMRPGKADIYIYLQNKKASNFDGILGVLPDGETGEVVITGDVKLNLMNALKQGETINLRWQRLQTQTQQLDLRFTYPFLFKTPLGIDLKMNLYRRDTLFSQSRFTAGLEYYFPGNNRLRVYVENQRANVITSQPILVSDLVDSRIVLVGLGCDLRNLDYRFNPRRGYNLEASVAAGRKNIDENANRDETFYDDLELETEIYNINIDGSQFFPIGKRSALHLRLQGGLFVNENMFRNEIYRIGGLKTLRGFDEQSIFASQFAIATIEYRFILEQNSNVFVFYDQAYYEDQARENFLSDTPLGFGAGINFETKPGIFSLTYALGQQFDNPVSLRSGKIHFGFVSFF